jgi:hypothetical protein
MNQSKNPKIIISINAYKLKALQEVINSCEKNVKEDFVIILNNSIDLDKHIRANNLFADKKNIVLNPEPIDKKRFTGSVVKGMVSNINFALKNIEGWEKFLITANRYAINKEISLNYLNRKRDLFLEHKKEGIVPDPQKICSEFYRIEKMKFKHGWMWPQFKETKLAKFFWNKPAVGCLGVGFFFDKLACEDIANFFKEHKGIAEDLFNSKTTAEEFALQTIVLNESGMMGDFKECILTLEKEIWY